MPLLEVCRQLQAGFGRVQDNANCRELHAIAIHRFLQEGIIIVAVDEAEGIQRVDQALADERIGSGHRLGQIHDFQGSFLRQGA